MVISATAMRMGLTAALLSFAACGFAQSSGTGKPGPLEDVHGLKVQEIHPAPTPSPFPLGAPGRPATSLEYRAPEAMTAADRSLAEGSQEEIARRAESMGIRVTAAEQGAGQTGQGVWGYEQALCPVFPNHLVLEYSRNNGPGDVTLFSAVIPRGGEGHVRVIPVRRRGYSLWTPASSNALTLNDFNHMVKEEGSLSPDWVPTGLCYAALTGGHARASLVTWNAEEQKFPLAIPMTLEVSRAGGAHVRFADSSALPGGRATDWDMQFAQDGRLLKVRHGDAHVLVETPVKEDASKQVFQPTKESEITRIGNRE
jgi:hypothetical protein